MATVEELASRVARLEREIQEIRESRGAEALAFGISVVQADTRAIRTELSEVHAEMATSAELEAVKAQLASVAQGVTEILARLGEAR
jgi:predicted  nucleic acid-binding Zn-ribbon protein